MRPLGRASKDISSFWYILFLFVRSFYGAFPIIEFTQIQLWRRRFVKKKKLKLKMSKAEVDQVITSFDNHQYVSNLFHDFNKTHYRKQWSHEKIVSTLQGAFSNGFHGIHFIPWRFEGCIAEILNDIVDPDHYLAYRICKKHGMIILQPNYKKLGIPPQSAVKYSYRSNKSIHALQEDEMFADFCYRLLQN